jgi:hypothetical protein
MTYHDDVVRSSGRQIVEPTRQVGCGREVLRLRRIEGKELLHVEELYSVVDTFTANDHVVFVALSGKVS